MSLSSTLLAKLLTEKSPPVPDVTAATRIKRACDVVNQWQTPFNEDYIATFPYRDNALHLDMTQDPAVV